MEGGRAWCGWALCERAAAKGKKERKKGWRIVSALLHYPPPWVYESVEDFSRGYAGFEARENWHGGWNDEIEDYIDDDD